MVKLFRKPENKFLFALLFFSISVGLWDNFRQLWMQDNGQTPTEISSLLSAGVLLCVVVILISAKFIKIRQLKTFIASALALKILILITLSLLNHSGHNSFISILIVIDAAIEKIVMVDIYPLIVTVRKNNTLYSEHRLAQYIGRDVGILIGGLLIGQMIGGLVIDYNICLIISILLLLPATIILARAKNTPCRQTRCKRVGILKYLFRHKLQAIYAVYCFIWNIAYWTALGLKMLVLTDNLDFSAAEASQLILLAGLAADLLGVVCLKGLQPKNDYFTMFIKFGIRAIGYLLVFFIDSPVMIVIALAWSLFIATAFENVIDAPYLNAVPNDKQLAFSNLIYIMKFLGEAAGMFFCGITYVMGMQYMFGLAGIFTFVQLGFGFYLIYLRKKAGKRRLSNKR